MKASEYKKALDPNIKRASQTTINQIKANINKQNKMKNMPAQKEDKEKEHKSTTFDGLREIVEMKKQKAVANELDSLIYEQEALKTKRSDGVSIPQQEIKKTPSPLEIWIAANPDKLKDMTMEEVAKMSMFTNQSGGSDPMSMLMAMTMNKKNSNGGENELTNTILKVLIEKMFADKGNGKSESNENLLVKYMMEQNLQNQKMMMAIIEKQNTPQKDNQNQTFLKEMFDMQRGKNDFENSFLKDKIRELEMRTQGNDPLGEAKRMIDYVKTFGSVFGGQNTTPAAMEHEIKLKELNFEQQKQVNEEARRAASMNQIGDMINNTIETFGKVLGEPIAEAAKSKIEQYTESAKHPENTQRVRISPEQYKQEIDLGDLENLEADLELHETPQTAKTRSARFKVSESGH